MKNLTTTAQQECLFLARKTLHERVRGQREGTAYTPVQPELLEPRGAFVTLRRDGELRGCIGYIEAVRPLWETIETCTESAALRDFRFPPVRPEELPSLHIEISVLSPLETVDDPERILVGQHGIVMSAGGRRGLLLPQVATEYGWDREQFLQHTCRKAGLPADAWKQGAKIEIFSADVFGEER